ncbi:MAG: O-antigen ligase family protein [Candidatus Paceibacterota bacterium]|jgi:O-antigen ligase
MSISISKIFYIQIIIVVLMILGILPQESSYLILAVMCYGFYRMTLLDSLGLFIISIPFFTALPGNQFSDSMSVWRILIAALFAKAVIGRYCLKISGKGAAEKVKNMAAASIISVREKAYGRLFGLFVLFIIINLLSLAEAHYIGAGIKKILFIVNIALLFPVSQAAISRKEDVLSVLKYLLQCSLIVAFIGYFQLILTFFVPLFKFWQFWTNSVIKVFYGENLSTLLSYSNTWFSYYDVLPATLRMFSVFPDSHSFSLFILIAMPVVLFFIVHEKGPKKNNIILAMSLYLLALFFSGSRGVWASSVAALAIGVAYFTNFRSKINGIKDLSRKMRRGAREKINPRVILFSIMIFFILMPISGFVLRKNQEVQLSRSGVEIGDVKEEAMFKRLVSISNFTESSNMGRIEIWNRTIESINRHYLFGVGVGNFPLILDEEMGTAKMGSSAHNIYFDIAAETGVFGLLVFILINFEILLFSNRLFRKELAGDEMKIFAGAFFAYFFWVLIYGLFDVVLFNDKVLMFTVLVIAVLYSLKGAYFKDRM